jgi:uncharacterized membrane protein
VVIAAFRDGLYNVVLALHIISVVLAFAPAIAHPLTAARVKQASGETGLVEAAKVMVTNTRTVYFPALIAIGPLGVLMVLLSDDVWEFDQAWVMASLVVWIVICGIVSAMIIPGERAVAAGDVSAEKKVNLGGQAATIAFIVIIWLMIWKPGL